MNDLQPSDGQRAEKRVFRRSASRTRPQGIYDMLHLFLVAGAARKEDIFPCPQD